MSKGKSATVFFCNSCGFESSKWMGQCPGCKEWNTFVDEPVEKKSSGGGSKIGLKCAAPVLLKDITGLDEERFSTGIGELNRVLGSGIVKGSLVLIGGDPGIGKSTLLLQTVSSLVKGVNKQGVPTKCVYISGEESIDQVRLRAMRLGLAESSVSLASETHIRDIVATLDTQDPPDIVVIDSVAALTPKAEIEGDMGDNKVGLQARLMSQALRKLTSTISKTNTTCIFINQLREKIGVMFGNPETTTGGNALKFYASVRIDIRRATQIKAGDEIIGNSVRVKVVKNKVAPPFRKAEFDIMFGEGVSRSGEIVDLGVEYGIIKKAGSFFSYNGSKLAQGRDATKSLMLDNPELAEEIEELIMKKILGGESAPAEEEESED